MENSSTELLLRRIADATARTLGEKSRHTFIRLNDLDMVLCQACGEDPTPAFCFIEDEMTRLYRKLIDCDCLLIGSPIYFDSVSAQTKAFIDRCNCLKPVDFDNVADGSGFVRRLTRKRTGAMVLVGGEQAWFEGARRCLAGFFKWIEVTNEAYMKFSTTDVNRIGEAADCPKGLAEADRIGQKLARRLVR